MTINLKNIANSYFKSWKAHDFDNIRSILSDDITFIGALGEAHGIDECMNGLQALTSIMADIVIHHMWIDEFDVITWYDLYTTKTSKPLPVANWMHVENDKITKIRVTFDPRPLLE
jgi:hypothetical protein